LEDPEVDVVLWDLGREAPARVDALADPRGDGPPVIALAPDDAQAATALAAGIRGYLSRDIDARRLTAALSAAASGLVVLDPEIVSHPLPARASPQMIEDLTPREIEVLQLLAEGMANKAIATRLGISEHTAKFHVNAILGKLGARSRTEAVITAARHGLITF
jgi:two-component system nitrate/nitrite response regulator NarL